MICAYSKAYVYYNLVFAQRITLNVFYRASQSSVFFHQTVQRYVKVVEMSLALLNETRGFGLHQWINGKQIKVQNRSLISRSLATSLLSQLSVSWLTDKSRFLCFDGPREIAHRNREERRHRTKLCARKFSLLPAEELRSFWFTHNGGWAEE